MTTQEVVDKYWEWRNPRLRQLAEDMSVIMDSESLMDFEVEIVLNMVRASFSPELELDDD